jgi:hypothetical protein
MAKGEKKTTPKKSSKRTKKTAAVHASRVRNLTPKQSKDKAKAEVKTRTPILGSFKLTWESMLVIYKFWKPLGAIILIYLILNIIFASGLSAINTAGDNFRDVLDSSNSNRFSEAFTSLGSLFGNSGSYSPQGNSVLQTFLLIIESLVIIWALRHVLAEKTIKVKDAYYHSTGPLIPFILVILVILFQLLPLTIGSSALGILLTSNFGNSFISFLFILLFVLLGAWSLYMLCASIFALYIVTLPDMQPRQALRSAKTLVKYRRLIIARRLLFLPLVIVILMGMVMYPIILFVSIAAPAVFYVLGILALLFTHTYLYNLYRNLLE